MEHSQDRLGHAARELAEGRPVVRAVIVRTWGSTPREVGADMLVDSTGELKGTVGGGCGEAEVYELAREMLEDPKSPKGCLCHVNLTEDPDEGGEKVCGGRFDVLLARWESAEEAELVESALLARRSGQPVGLKTCWSDVAPGYWRKVDLPSMPLTPRLSLSQPPDDTPRLSEQGGEYGFEEPLGGQLRLVIVGAGHIARPLARLAHAVGYEVFVLDDRSDYARSEFFPEAREVRAGDYELELPGLAAHPRTSVVLVTRGHRHDQACLRLMASEPLEYLGMIGSRRRIDAVFAELVEEGVGRELLERVHAPIGLEIGAQTPAEIAVSIMAQMIQKRRQPQFASRSAVDRRRS